MPDWAAVTIGVVLGVGLGLVFGVLLLLWYLNKDRP